MKDQVSITSNETICRISHFNIFTISSSRYFKSRKIKSKNNRFCRGVDPLPPSPSSHFLSWGVPSFWHMSEWFTRADSFVNASNTVLNEAPFNIEKSLLLKVFYSLFFKALVHTYYEPVH